MLRIAAKDQSLGSLVDEDASKQLTRGLDLRPVDAGSVAFVGYSTWRRDEFGDANLFDEQVFVVRDGRVCFLNPHYELEKFSPDGLSWGYPGSASAQLAIAMLMEVLGDWNRVKSVWAAFHDRFVVKLPRNANWTVDGSTVLAIALTLENRKSSAL